MAKESVLLACAMVVALLSGCAVNPVTGDQELMFFSSAKDVQLGRKYAPQFEEALGGRIPDEHLQSYLNRVGQRIARVCHQPDLAYHFTAIQEESINAFAVPGGYIFITRGLLEELESEAQLAGILGHEVGHVVARDTMAAMSRQIGMGALIAAAAVGNAPADVTHAASFITGVLSLQYSREDEMDADLVGLSYMIQAGYDPQGMVQTLQILQGLQTVRPIEFFSTHPNPENRIAYIEDRIARRYKGMEALKDGTEDYEASVRSRLEQEKKGSRRQTPDPSSDT